MKQRLLIAMTIAAVGALLLGIVTLGQGTGTPIWHTVDGGGGASQGDTFTVRGTIGQPDAGILRGAAIHLPAASGAEPGRSSTPFTFRSS